ncbi:MAG: PA14 domain-containing protein [Bacteroidia bacterium]
MKYIGLLLTFLLFILTASVNLAQTQNPLRLSMDTTYIGCDLAPVNLKAVFQDLSGRGLTYKYYNGSWNSLPDFTTLTPTDSGEVDNLDISVRNDNSNYGFVFKGYIYLETAGSYTFYTSSDDGSKLFVNGSQVVNNDGLHGNQERSGTVSLSQGMHAIEVQFFEKSGGETLSWKYAGPNITKQAVPDNLLYLDDLSNLTFAWTGPNGFTSSISEPQVSDLGTYRLHLANADTFIVDSLELLMYETPVFEAQGAWLTCADDSVQIGTDLANSMYTQGLEYAYYEGSWSTLPDFSTLNPAFRGTVENFTLEDRLQDDYFAFVFTGEIYLETSGEYTFYISSDDGSEFWIDGQELVDNDGLHGMRERNASITLSAGYHPIEVQFFERNGGANLSVSYAGPGFSKTLLPAEILFYKNISSYRYSWVGPNGFTDSLAQVYVQEPGIYTLTITNESTQCSSTDTAIVAHDCSESTGRIFADVNENGAFDEGEATYDSVKVYLLNTTMAIVDSTTSDSSGVFKFEQLSPGDYQYRLFNLPINLDLISGMSGFVEGEQDGTRFITTPIQRIENASANSMPIPMASSVQLPVEYLDFQVKVDNDYMTLVWTTAWEQNNARFVVERSIDGQTFGRIAKVESKGDSQAPVSYRFVDEDRGLAHMVDQWYYRLRQVDLDGQFSLSPIVLARMDAGDIPLEVVGYPNPLTGPELQIRYSGADQNDELELEVINTLGKSMLTKSLAIGEGQEITIDVESWPAGYYYLQVQSGEQKSVFKLQKLY